jgi:hypothetical protein
MKEEMKIILTCIFCGLYFIGFGQEKVALKDGTKIIIYPDKTWKYESEIKDIKVDSDAIILNLSDHEIWKHPLMYYSSELTTFSKISVELIGYSNSYFIVKSNNGQIGYAFDLDIKNDEEYIRILDNRLVQKAKFERKKILIKGFGVDDKNSAGGIDIFIDWGYFDYSKDIKYISFTVVPYNNVGDIQTCSLSGKSAITCMATGPISASDSFNASNYGAPFKWDNVWYNKTITCIKLTKVVVQYIDGSSYVYVNELPKIMANKYINSCE